MKFIDANYNDGKLAAISDESRNEEWLNWADTKVSKATVPILYGTLGSAFKTTTRISKIEKLKINVREVSKEDIKSRNLPNQTSGLVITQIDSNSPLTNSIEINAIILEAQKMILLLECTR